MATEGLPVQLACRVLEVCESGYYARRSRAPSPRCIRHEWLTDVIRQVHALSRGTYGIRRVLTVVSQRFTAKPSWHNRVTDVSQIFERLGDVSPFLRWFPATFAPARRH